METACGKNYKQTHETGFNRTLEEWKLFYFKFYPILLDMFQSNLRGMETDYLREEITKTFEFQSNLRGMETSKCNEQFGGAEKFQSNLRGMETPRDYTAPIKLKIGFNRTLEEWKPWPGVDITFLFFGFQSNLRGMETCYNIHASPCVA